MGFESINNFIERKNKIEQKRPKLEMFFNLITIDGVDGAGKDTIAKYVKEQLSVKYPHKVVSIVDITHFSGSLKQERLKDFKDSGKISKDNFDKLYTAGLNRAYEEVVLPKIEADEIVIIPRSEVNLLRYAYQKENKEMIENRINNIEDGTMSHKTIPGNRIFINVDPETQMHYLDSRGNLSEYDPKNIEESNLMVESQKKAFSFIKENKPVDQNIIIFDNKEQDHKSLDEYLRQSAKEIVSKIYIK